MNERNLDADTVRKRHLAEVSIGLHALYLVAVPGLGLLLMVVLLALLDAT